MKYLLGFQLLIIGLGIFIGSIICWTKEPFKTQRLQDQLEWELEVETKHGEFGCR